MHIILVYAIAQRSGSGQSCRVILELYLCDNRRFESTLIIDPVVTFSPGRIGRDIVLVVGCDVICDVKITRDVYVFIVVVQFPGH